MRQSLPWRRRPSWYLAACLVLTACNQPGSIYSEAVPLFGTLVEIQIWNKNSNKARDAVAAVKKDFARMHQHWHAWRPGMLTDLNRELAAGRESEVDAFLLPLLREARTLYRTSDGLFNPAIGRLVALWGFHADTLPSGPPPNIKAIGELVEKNPTMDDIEIRGNRVHSRNRYVQLDLGGLGKGAAVDAGLERLKDSGISHALINAGGDLCAIGRPGDRPWRVGIARPQGKQLLASLALDGDECVFTSGTYARYRRSKDKQYSHIIDPRNGWPVEHVVSVTVIHDNGTSADAAATALAIAGPEHWRDIARKMGIRHVLLVDSNQRVQFTPSMQGRIHFETPLPVEMLVTPL